MADEIATTLRKALGKLNSQKAHLDRQISALEAALGVLGGSPHTNGQEGHERGGSQGDRQADEGVLGEAPAGSREGPDEGVEIGGTE